jgi:hypothetical protein
VSTAIAIVENPAESTHTNAAQLGAEITELCSYIYAAESRLLTLIREFDEKEFRAEQGLCSCAHWLNFKCGIGMNAARKKVRVAHALAKLPKINKTFAEGVLSYSKVRALTRIADDTNEDYLLMIAEHGTAHHVEKLVSIKEDKNGETSMDNLVLLCRHHHHLVHERGFVCEKSANGEMTFRDQRQQTLDSLATMPGVAANDDVRQWIDREFFEANIDSETCTAATDAEGARRVKTGATARNRPTQHSRGP